MLPLVNATVTAITAPGSSEDYGSAGGAGSTLFSGEAPAYVTQQMFQNANGEKLDQITVTRLVLNYNVGNLVQRGGTITFSTDGVVSTRIVRELQRYLLFGTTRVWFRDV